ncbi:hypothetical protein Bhyg_00410, partial [Pseudolycoriella hygida]
RYVFSSKAIIATVRFSDFRFKITKLGQDKLNRFQIRSQGRDDSIAVIFSNLEEFSSKVLMRVSRELILPIRDWCKETDVNGVEDVVNECPLPVE